MGRNSERCSYHTDLSRFVLPISDPSALNISQFVGFQTNGYHGKKEIRLKLNEVKGVEKGRSATSDGGTSAHIWLTLCARHLVPRLCAVPFENSFVVSSHRSEKPNGTKQQLQVFLLQVVDAPPLHVL